MTSRWLLKRTLKWSVEWGMALSGAGVLYRGTRYFQKGLRILTYHHVGDRPGDSFTIGTAHFRAHMAYLADHHPVVGLTELATRLAFGPPPEPGTVALTNFFEGVDDKVPVSCVLLRTTEPVTRVLAIDPANTGVRLRRVLDQSCGPQRALVLVDGAPLPAGRGVYLFRERRSPAARCVEMPADAGAYAAVLYETLHREDAAGWDWIAVERPPEGPEWAGVADRLTRAESKRSGSGDKA